MQEGGRGRAVFKKVLWFKTEPLPKKLDWKVSHLPSPPHAEEAVISFAV